MSISALLLAAAVQTAGAYDFESGGLYYNFVSVGDRTVTLVAGDEKYSGDIVIPDSVYYNTVPFAVMSITDYAFNQCTGLTSVALPATVKTIGAYAFSGCSALSDVSFSEGLNTIGNYAFNECKALRSATLPEGLTLIGDRGFINCSNLKEVKFPSTLTTINQYAFEGCHSIETLSIPASVTTVGRRAFTGCSELKTLRFEDGERNLIINNSVSSEGGFYAPNLQQLYVGRNFARQSWPNDPTSYTWPNDWLWDPNSNINANISLKYVEFGNTVTVIPNNILGYNAATGSAANRGDYYNNVETLILGENVETISTKAFSGCTKLKNLVLPDATKNLGNWAFGDCYALETIVFGSKLTTLGENVFAKSHNIQTITARMEIPSAFNTENVFTWNTYLNSTLYVPEGSKPYYAERNYWRNFLRVEEGEPEAAQRHQLTVDVNGGGVATVVGHNVRQANYSLFVEEGKEVVVTFSADERYVLASVTLNGTNVKPNVKENSYTLPAMTDDAVLRVEFTEVPVWITLRDSKAGSFREHVAYGGHYTYDILPDNANKVHTVMFNDVDVTAELDADGTYTTPAITTPSTLTVIFEETGAGIESPAASAVRIVPTTQGIRIQGAERGTRIAVYDADGRTVTSCLSQGGSDAIALSASQTYVISVGERTFKVRL